MLGGCSSKTVIKAEDLICEDHCKVLDVSKYGAEVDESAVIYELDTNDYEMFMAHKYEKTGLMFVSGNDDVERNKVAVQVLTQLAKETKYPIYYTTQEVVEEDCTFFSFKDWTCQKYTSGYSDDYETMYTNYKEVLGALPELK